MQMECHVERLKRDLLTSDKEKNESFAMLSKAEQRIQVLTATMDTLTTVSTPYSCLRGTYSFLQL